MRPTGKIRPARFDCDTVPLLAPLRVAADFLLGVAIVNWRKRELQTTHQPASSITTPSAAPKPRSPTRRPRCVLEGFSVAFEKKKSLMMMLHGGPLSRTAHHPAPDALLARDQ